MLFQPTNVIPSLFANPENTTVTKSDPIYIAWQVNGNSPLTKAVVRVLTNDPSHTQVGNALTITPLEPFYPTDSRGNPRVFEYESETATWGNSSQFGLQNGNDYLLTIEQFWSETESITMYAPVAFRCRDLPVFLPNESGETIVMTEDKGISKTFKPFNYSHTDDAPIAYVRWVLYDSDGNVIDDTGEVYTQIMEYTYDCFEEGKEYTLDVRVTNIFGQTPSARRKIGKWDPQELYWHYTNFTPVVRCRPDDTIAIEFPTITNPNVQFAVVRCDEDGSNAVNLGLYPNTTIIVKDFGIQSGKSYIYRVYLYDSAAAPFPTAFPVEPPVSKQFSAFSLVECAETSDGEYTYVNLYRFASNVATGDVSNNNSPTFLQNFTKYPLRQASRTAPKSGSLQALICNPIMGEYSDNAERMEQLFALSQSENVFFLKDPKGNIYKVHTSAPITQAVSNGATQQVTVNIPWQEIGSAKGAAITDAGTSAAAISALEAAERAIAATNTLRPLNINAQEKINVANDTIAGLVALTNTFSAKLEALANGVFINRTASTESEAADE